MKVHLNEHVNIDVHEIQIERKIETLRDNYIRQMPPLVLQFQFQFQFELQFQSGPVRFGIPVQFQSSCSLQSSEFGVHIRRHLATCVFYVKRPNLPRPQFHSDAQTPFQNLPTTPPADHPPPNVPIRGNRCSAWGLQKAADKCQHSKGDRESTYLVNVLGCSESPNLMRWKHERTYEVLAKKSGEGEVHVSILAVDHQVFEICDESLAQHWTWKCSRS